MKVLTFLYLIVYIYRYLTDSVLQGWTNRVKFHMILVKLFPLTFTLFQIKSIRMCEISYDFSQVISINFMLFEIMCIRMCEISYDLSQEISIDF